MSTMNCLLVIHCAVSLAVSDQPAETGMHRKIWIPVCANTSTTKKAFLSHNDKQWVPIRIGPYLRSEDTTYLRYISRNYRPSPAEYSAGAKAQMKTSRQRIPILGLGNESTQASRVLRGQVESRTGYIDQVHVSIPILNKR